MNFPSVDIYEIRAENKEISMSAAEEFTQTALSGIANANSVARHFIQRNLALRQALKDLELGALMLQDPIMSPDTIRYAKEVQRIAGIALANDDACTKAA